MSVDDRRQVGIFAKYWQPGKAKTRLAAAIGNEAAADLARAFLSTLITRLETINECRRVIGYWPPNRFVEFQEVALRWELQLQCEGDLGKRMKRYFQESFASGATEVLLIGADCPTMPLQRIQDAFEALQHCDMVLGPAGDGGYYLIGARSVVPPVFEHVEWGSDTVLETTLALAQKHDIEVSQIAPWDDIDDIHDLKRIRTEMRSPQYSSPVWEPLRDSISRALGDVE